MWATRATEGTEATGRGRSPLRPHERAAVGHERVAREISARIAAEEQGDRRDVELGIALALHRAVLDEDAIPLALLPGGAVVRGGRRRDRVDDDPVQSPLARGGARQRAD